MPQNFLLERQSCYFYDAHLPEAEMAVKVDPMSTQEVLEKALAQTQS